MAGMLPGVECARRRRFHQGGGGGAMSRSVIGNGRTRHSTFCLYTSNHEQAYLNSSSFMQRNTNSWDDYKLEDAAREAKERLDERLVRNQWKLQPQREGNIKGYGRSLIRVVQRVMMFGFKRKSKLQKPCWELGDNTADEQEDLAECLEAFEGCESLVRLPCAGRFHSRCLLPWLESYSDQYFIFQEAIQD